VKPVTKTVPVTTITPVPKVDVGSRAAAVAPADDDAARRVVVIVGLGFGALLFFLALVVPATAVRFTVPGRTLMDHQTDVVLAGVATLALTAILFAVTAQ
jgi:hypothetical protein